MTVAAPVAAIPDAFLLTRPSRGVTYGLLCTARFGRISTHTPLAGRDSPSRSNTRTLTISTHTPLAGRDLRKQFVECVVIISTHTPLAGRDQRLQSPVRRLSISTHTPLAGRDVNAPAIAVMDMAFLLTRPSRGVTAVARSASELFQISTHTPLAGRDPHGPQQQSSH